MAFDKLIRFLARNHSLYFMMTSFLVTHLELALLVTSLVNQITLLL